jgi:hypothetical protein
MSNNHRHPNIVEFVDPLGWGKSNEKKRKSNTDDQQQQQHQGQRPFKQPIFDFESAKKEVLSLGSSGLTEKERKKLKEQRLLEMGFPPIKKKVPLKILFGSTKKRLQREQREKQAQRDAGGVMVNSATAFTSSKFASKTTTTSKNRNRKKRHGGGGGGGNDSGVLRIRDVTTSSS